MVLRRNLIKKNTERTGRIRDKSTTFRYDQGICKPGCCQYIDILCHFIETTLSTTYVTFMVAMGTSLSDRAWGRESAVYRITGVFSVVGGWFFTAFSAFTVAFLIATAIKIGGFITIIFLLVWRFSSFTELISYTNAGILKAESIEDWH